MSTYPKSKAALIELDAAIDSLEECETREHCQLALDEIERLTQALGGAYYEDTKQRNRLEDCEAMAAYPGGLEIIRQLVSWGGRENEC